MSMDSVQEAGSLRQYDGEWTVARSTQYDW